MKNRSFCLLFLILFGQFTYSEDVLTENIINGRFETWENAGYSGNSYYNYQIKFYEENKILFVPFIKENNGPVISDKSMLGTFYMENNIVTINFTHNTNIEGPGPFSEDDIRNIRIKPLAKEIDIRLEINIIENKLIINRISGKNIFEIFNENIEFIITTFRYE
jgi:hypothetical protein